MKIKSVPSLEQLARYLVSSSSLELEKVLTALPTNDRLRVLEEVRKIKDDSPKNC